MTSHREHLVLEVKLAESVILVPLVTRDHLELLDLKDLKVMPAPGDRLELRASVDQMDKLLVVMVIVNINNATLP